MSAILTGFLLMAPPTARTALGFPAISARRLYETVSPNFTSLRSMCNTRLVNASMPRSRGHGESEWTEEERALYLINQTQTADWEADDNKTRRLVQHGLCCLWNKLGFFFCWVQIKSLRHHKISTHLHNKYRNKYFFFSPHAVLQLTFTFSNKEEHEPSFFLYKTH